MHRKSCCFILICWLSAVRGRTNCFFKIIFIKESRISCLSYISAENKNGQPMQIDQNSRWVELAGIECRRFGLHPDHFAKRHASGPEKPIIFCLNWKVISIRNIELLPAGLPAVRHGRQVLNLLNISTRNVKAATNRGFCCGAGGNRTRVQTHSS